MNYYEPKFLRGIIQKTLPLKLFFRTRFFSDTLTFPTEKVSFEFAADKRRLMPYATARGGSVPIDREGYQLKTFTPPLLSGSRIITNDTLATKVLGESEWNSGITPDERSAMIAAQDLTNLQDALYLKEEYMCARIKQDGKLEYDLNGAHYDLDYDVKNIINVKAADRWTENFDLLGALKDACNTLRKEGINPDMLILGQKASQALVANKGFQDLMLSRNNLIDIPPDPADLERGINYIAHIHAPGINLAVYEYLEYFYDEASKSSKPLLDDTTAILQSSQEKNMMLYGAIAYIPDGANDYVTVMDEYVPYVVVDRDPPMKKLIVSSRPLPMPVDNQSWLVFKNVVAAS